MAATYLSDLIDPEVMADMISAKVPNALVVTPFATIDTTLQGQPGSTITVPAYDYIGDAVDVAEGAQVESVKLTTTSREVSVKKAAKDVVLTDEAVLSGYGNPVGQANTQIAQAIAAKVDSDAISALFAAQRRFDGSGGIISYLGIVNAIDIFAEEVNVSRVMFIHPKQTTQLRADPDFVSADKYKEGVAVTGEIGTIAGTRIVPSRKVPAVAYFYKFDDSASAATADNIADVQATLPTAKVGDKVRKVNVASYLNPIVQLTEDSGTDEAAALTIYVKRSTNIETDRLTGTRSTLVAADQHYAAALSNNSKVVVAAYKQQA